MADGVQEQVRRLAALVEERQTENARLKGELAALREENARLVRRVAELEEELQGAHRQAAPFRRREQIKKPEAERKRPGRPEGHPGEYRRRPAQVDREVEVPLACCPHCAGPLSGLEQRAQYIEEIPPVRPLCVKVTTWTGVCGRCGRVESRHPLQTSTAVGAAGNHLGPRAQALAVLLSHRAGLTMSRTCQVLHDLCGLKLSRGGLAQLLQRAGRKLEPFYAEIRQRIQGSAAVFADETSWYVGRPGWWLWVFTTPAATLYRVEAGRGSDVVSATLGDEFGGMLVSDCLASYNPIECAKHKCIAHHLRVLAEQEQTLERRGVKSEYLLLWKLQLQDVIATWEKRDQREPAAYALKVRQLTRGVENLLARSPPEAEEVVFRNRMLRQRDHLLGCLKNPAAEPTNNRAERDLRPAVIDRKLSCGNKTPAGKQAWEVLRSVLVTLEKQGHDILGSLAPCLQLAAP
jgi:transposase